MPENLLPCPFCGSDTATSITKCEDLWMEDINSCAVNCDFNDGGCGACGGYRYTQKEAVDLWNTRWKVALKTYG